MMQTILLTALMFLVTAAPLRAQETPPRDQGTAAPPDRVRGVPDWFRDRGGQGIRIEEAEWPQVEQFMKDNSPKRWQMYQAAPPGQQRRLRGPIWAAWKNLEKLRTDEK